MGTFTACSDAPEQCREVSLTCCEDNACVIDTCDDAVLVVTECEHGCQSGMCLPATCVPECTTPCGPDGCGGECNECDNGETCSDGACACLETPEVLCCDDNTCLSSGCGAEPTLLGTCPFGCANGVCATCDAPCETECGLNACGQSCGTCSAGESCVDGACACVLTAEVVCCDGGLCSLDSCGGVSDPIVACDNGCSDGACLPCVPSCDASACGPDGCGGSCGACQPGASCSDGACICQPAVANVCCAGDRCEMDGCGEVSGPVEECPFGCLEGACLPCEPACDGRTCGADGCGGSCGSCPVDSTCLNGQCECNPGPAAACCGSAVCELDACGTPIAVTEICDHGCQDALCLPCVPSCDGAVCGDDGCGGDCGQCGLGETCAADGTCAPCVPDCSGKNCGSDGCGGTCGTCDPGDGCDLSATCVPGLTGNVTRQSRAPTDDLTTIGLVDVIAVGNIEVVATTSQGELGRAVTDASGAYVLGATAPPGLDVELTIVASMPTTPATPLPRLAVFDPNGSGPISPSSPHELGAAWAWTRTVSAADAASGNLGTFEIGIAEGSGALAIIDAFSEWLVRSESFFGLPASAFPTVAVYWAEGWSPACGSCFYPSNYGPYTTPGAVSFDRLVAIGGTVNAPQHWTPSLLGHEFCHYLHDGIGHFPNVGGAHSWTSLISPTLAWTEGFATFCGQWLVGDTIEQPRYFSRLQGTDYWIDIELLGAGPDSDAANLSFLTFPKPTSSTVFQTLNEAVVAAILWDIFDTHQAPLEIDTATLGADAMLSLLDPRLTTPSVDAGFPSQDLVDYLDTVVCQGLIDDAVLTPLLMTFPYVASSAVCPP